MQIYLMKTFLIKDLEKISGIKAQSIRMWERRYNFFTPRRTSTNIRKYGIDELKHLLHVALLLKAGNSISDLSKIPLGQIEISVSNITSEEISKEKVIADIIYAMYIMDVGLIESLLNNSVNKWGIDDTIGSIIIPFLGKVDMTSYKDTTCETHFAVTAIRRKIIMGIESYNNYVSQGPTALLFLPSTEHYDLMLLYMNYVLRKKGITVLYLGTNISIDNLHTVLVAKSPDILCTYISHFKKEQHNPIFKYILSQNPKPKLCVVSDRIKQRSSATLLNFDFIHFNDFEDIDHTL